jgi:hypothetical protein
MTNKEIDNMDATPKQMEQLQILGHKGSGKLIKHTTAKRLINKLTKQKEKSTEVVAKNLENMVNEVAEDKTIKRAWEPGELCICHCCIAQVIRITWDGKIQVQFANHSSTVEDKDCHPFSMRNLGVAEYIIQSRESVHKAAEPKLNAVLNYGINELYNHILAEVAGGHKTPDKARNEIDKLTIRLVAKIREIKDAQVDGVNIIRK